MKFTRSAVYKLRAAAECGCVAYSEFADPDMKQEIAKVFKPCDPKHSVLEAIMYESIDEKVRAGEPPPPRNFVDEEGNLLPVKERVDRSPLSGAGDKTLGPPKSAGSHRPGSRPPVTSPFHRVEETKLRVQSTVPKLAGVASVVKAATTSDFDGVEEDPRVTNLLETCGILDPETDDGDTA